MRRRTRSLFAPFVPVILLSTLGVAAAGCAAADDVGAQASDDTSPASRMKAVKTVFVIVMENHSWSSIKGKKDAAYINSLLPLGSHAEDYNAPVGNHPSERNYLWLEGGDNFGITKDSAPGTDHQATKDHLVSQLERAGISWKSYQEDIDGTTCPLTNKGLYVARHNPMVFFDDITGTNDPNSQHCIDHVRPYDELKKDLAANTVAKYNFITPNLCHDMHGQVVGLRCETLFGGLVKRGDKWLATAIPMIMASKAYKDNGAIFLTWDEGDEKLALSFPPVEAEDKPIGMIVLSPLVKPGRSSNVHYTHSSTLRTFETIFGVPFLRDAARATDLSDMFAQ